ncbi:putative bifunctional diguanylate cyclase/phosphodiesterase [Solihabitans fulvus]|nr:EAL domain-containing protein [Solihabitans fulvus]
MVDQVPTAPEPRGGLGVSASREAVARSWASAISNTSLTSIPRDELEQLLLGFVDELLAALTSEPFSTVVGQRVGAALVTNDFVCSATVERTIELLGNSLLAPLRLPADSRSNTRLVRLLGALAAGYSDALRDRTLDQQELSKTAAVNTIRKAEHALRISEAKFRAVFTSSAVGIGVTAMDGRVLDFNDAMLNILGYSADELRRLSVRDLIHPDDRASLALSTEELTVSGREHFRAEKRMLRNDGEVVSTLIAVSLVRDTAGAPAYHVTMVENLNELRLLQDQLLKQSLHDVQTALPNRSQFLGWLESAAGSKGPERVALCLFDIDGFRVINDGFSHDVGNRVLLSVANHLRAVFGDVGQVARTGGDEFGVLIRNPADLTSVIEKVEAAIELLAEPIYVDDRGIAVSVSVGIVQRPTKGVDAAELLRAADVTVGWAKADGRAQWALYDPDRDARERVRCTVVASIPGAMEEGQFRIDYEPVHLLADGRMVAVHAMLRWEHPTLGVLSVQDFLGLTEATGIAIRLGRWTLEQACTQAGGWYERFGDAAPLLCVELTARQCREPDLVADVRRILEAAGLPERRLRLSLGERIASALTDEQVDELSFLTDNGVRLVLDDYGSGNIGLHRLRQIPLEAVRLADVILPALSTEDDPISRNAVGWLIALAGELGYDVLAQGVRAESEVAALREIGVHAGQGAYFGPALTGDEVEAYLAATAR